MQKVRSEYDHCKKDYESNMHALYEQPVDMTTTTTTTTEPPGFMQITLMKRQQLNSVYVSHETTTMPVKNLSDPADQEHPEKKMKIVCW